MSSSWSLPVPVLSQVFLLAVTVFDNGSLALLVDHLVLAVLGHVDAEDSVPAVLRFMPVILRIVD